jgi:hypothetical protein
MTGASEDRDKGESEDKNNSWRSEDSEGKSEAVGLPREHDVENEGDNEESGILARAFRDQEGTEPRLI